MLKLNNMDYKSEVILLSCICLFGAAVFAIISYIYCSWIIGTLILSFGIVTGTIVFFVNWPETIIIDEENIIVYRFGKVKNKIKKQNVVEIFRQASGIRFCSYYYFSDGYDRFLNDKRGNEHYIVFRFSMMKEYQFSKFIDLPIQDLIRDE